MKKIAITLVILILLAVPMTGVHADELTCPPACSPPVIVTETPLPLIPPPGMENVTPAPIETQPPDEPAAYWTPPTPEPIDPGPAYDGTPREWEFMSTRPQELHEIQNTQPIHVLYFHFAYWNRAK